MNMRLCPGCGNPDDFMQHTCPYKREAEMHDQQPPLPEWFMNLADMLDRIVVDGGTFRFRFAMRDSKRPALGAMLMGTYDARCISSGEVEPQTTRKWYISRHMSRSEFVQTCFKCYLTSQEHQARETFRYRGKAVFGPHFDIEALCKICSDKQFDYRAPQYQDGAEG